MNQPIYMDYAAATPMDDRVLAAMEPFFKEKFYNPSSVYLASRGVKDDLQAAKEKIAYWLGARPSEVVLTAGATEANNLALQGMCSSDGEILYSSIEHEAVIEPAGSRRHTVVPVNEHGLVEAEKLRESITEYTELVSIMYANNEIGTVQHIADLAQVVRDERERRREAGQDRPIYFHTDASQAPNYLDMHVDKLHVDMMTINAGKMYGPKQVGALYVRAGIELTPIIAGGGQERGLRSGTENIAGAAGLAAALEIAQKMRKDESYRIAGLSRKLKSGIEQSFSNATFLGHKKHRIPNITSVVIPGIDGERVVMMLDEAGLQIATGSACGAQRDESSHVVRALGYSEDQARSTLRISLGRQSTEDHIDKLLEVLPGIIEQARSL